MSISRQNFIKITDFLWEIPQSFRPEMRVPARVFASAGMLDNIGADRSLEQLVNVATLPGINRAALAMPDIHEGYGFPIGGVAAMDYPDGLISPGGIGYDINCGVRLLLSPLTDENLKPYLAKLADRLYQGIPSGVGRGGVLKLNQKEMDEVLRLGVPWLVEKGYGEKEDLDFIESGGSLKNADPAVVSPQAKKRGADQLGTLGAGNHFVEIDRVEEVFDEKTASAFGLYPNQIVIMIHTGSRGLGHQVATDFIQVMIKAAGKYGLKLPDRELAGAPLSSPEGADYFKAMAAAANFAWANREVLAWEVRRVWQEVLGKEGGVLSLLYDVAHNIAKIEEHSFDRQTKKVIVHRKGATRSFPGQPVIIPGSMGSASFVLVGSEGAMKESFGSTCHGAGRAMSRHAALQKASGSQVKTELEAEGILVRTGSISGLAEEAPYAYKKVDEVVEVVERANLAKKICRLRPQVVIKG